MANQNIPRNILRIPNLPMGPLVDKDGRPTDEEQTFRQALVTLLENILSEEGLVMPSQTTVNINAIQNFTETTPSGTYGTPIVRYTCQAGTFIYDTDLNVVKVAILVGGNPIFKTVTVT